MISVVFLRELLNTSAVCEQADFRSGYENSNHTMEMRAIGTCISYVLFQYDVEIHSDTLVFEARERAVDIFQTGQDYKREIQLHDNMIKRFK